MIGIETLQGLRTLGLWLDKSSTDEVPACLGLNIRQIDYMETMDMRDRQGCQPSASVSNDHTSGYVL